MTDVMTPRERALREERAQIWEGQKAVMEKWQNGKKELTAEKRAEVDQRNKRLTEIEADLTLIKEFNVRESAKDEMADARGVSRDQDDDAEKRYTDAYVTWFKRGERSLTEEQRAVLDANALTTAPGAPAAGATGYDAGYMVPQGFWRNLQIALKAYGGILPYCKVLSTDTGNPMPWPTVDPTGVVGSYLTEINQLGFGGDSAGTDYQFGQGMLSAWTIVSGVILASIQLIQDSAFDVDSFVSDRMGEAIGRKVAQELHSGTGSSALLGVETALSARGYQSAGPGRGGVYKSGTATNWAATAGGNAYTLQGGTTAQAKLANKLIGFDDIIGMIETVDPAYRKGGVSFAPQSQSPSPGAIFVANDVTMSMLRTITDAYGHPLWNPDVRVGSQDAFYGFPLVIDQNTSGVSSTASTVGGLLFGDFSKALVVRQVNGAGTMRLVERYADYLQVGYLGWVRMDARSNDLRAAALYSTNAT